ncbi:MAG: molecular chaperone DnaJ [Deltaproteobacteria bacterium]|nr:molecular chaperone DnaJ [Deltaproteobacteria bacterium]
MESESCGLCGGDGRIGNSLGRTSATCPGCHGTGRRGEAQSRFRDVTKTKQSHHGPQRHEAQAGPVGPKVPVTEEGTQLAAEVTASALGDDAKKRLLAEIMNHEDTHGRCTKTFLKKIHKQVRPPSA